MRTPTTTARQFHGLDFTDAQVIADALDCYIRYLTAIITQGVASEFDIAEVWRATHIRNHILGGN